MWTGGLAFASLNAVAQDGESGGGDNGEGGGTIDGGELGGVTILCSTGNSGNCFYIAVEEGLYGACRFDCAYSGITDNYCSSFYIELVNFCSAYGGV